MLKIVLKKDTTIDYFNSQKLINKFPAQIRMTASEIRKTFPRALPLMRTGNYMSFPFDPVMGFRADEALKWYGGSLDDIKSKFLIVTFGGSTTVWENWPKYLKEYAQKENVEQDIIVLNAGHWGYMSFIEKIFFTSWVLPYLDEMGVKPDLVLSLDGVNDIWARIMGYFEKEKQNSPVWFSQYHGYHQQLDTDMKNVGKISGSLSQLISSVCRKIYDGMIYYFSPIFPYTFKGILESLRKIIQKSPSKEEIKKLELTNKIILGEEIEDKLILGYESNLLDFFACADVRNIQFVGYLQPVLLEKYYPHEVPKSFKYPSFNYFAVNFHSENRLWNRFDQNCVISLERLYEKVEKMYYRLNTLYPGCFENMAYVFKDIPGDTVMYKEDAIHYTRMGSERIAHTIINDLLDKKILSKKWLN